MWMQKAEKGLERLLIWTGGYTLLSGLFTMIARQLEFLSGFGWAEALVLGFLLASLAILVVSVGLIAWRKFRPLPGSVSEALVDAGANPTMADEFASMVTRLQESISDRAGDLHAVQRRIETLDAREQKFLEGEARRYQLLGEFKDRIEAIERTLSEDRALADERRTAMQATLDGLANDHAHTRRMARAIAHKSRMDERGAEILKGADVLTIARPEDAAELDWSDWSLRLDGWKSDIEAWIEWAREYTTSAHDQIFTVHGEEIRPDRGWTVPDNAFPDPKNCYEYRCFVMMFKKWRDVEKKAQVSLFKILFS